MAFIINVVITFLVGNGIPGTQSNEVLSAKYQTLVTPVGWAFSIWAIIFGSQLVFTITQIRPRFRGHALVQDGVGYNYVGVCLAQATWGLVFGFELINLSVAFMLLILCFLVRIVMNQGKVDRDDAHVNRDFFLFVFPFRIHCAWIVAASLVNINLVLVKNAASATAQLYTALASLGCLLVIALGALFARVTTDYVIPCVLAWAAVSFKLGAALVVATFSPFGTTSHYLVPARKSPKLGVHAELAAPNDLIRATFDQGTINLVQNTDGAVGWIIMICVVAKVILPTSLCTCRRRFPANEGETTLLQTNNSL